VVRGAGIDPHVHLTGGEFKRPHVNVPANELEGEPIPGNEQPGFPGTGNGGPHTLELVQV
jgi:hypothetical protein